VPLRTPKLKADAPRRFLGNEGAMSKPDLLAAMSVTSLVLLSVHVTDDYIQGFDKHVVNNPYGILFFVVVGCGIFLFRERVIGQVILLLGGVVAIAMPIMHLNGHFPADFARAHGAFRFIWTLYAIGTIGALTVILAARELFTRRAHTK
jgi:hypothetical protein